jgi:hypothetical protein
MKRATIRTTHERADLVAAALRPDNTDEMSTRVAERVDADEDGTDEQAVVTTIERETTGGLRTTADDYVQNLTVAQQLIDTTTQS